MVLTCSYICFVNRLPNHLLLSDIKLSYNIITYLMSPLIINISTSKLNCIESLVGDYIYIINIRTCNKNMCIFVYYLFEDPSCYLCTTLQIHLALQHSKLSHQIIFIMTTKFYITLLCITLLKQL